MFPLSKHLPNPATPEVSHSRRETGRRALFLITALYAAFSAGASAAPEKLLVDEHFSLPALPATWEPAGRPNSFSIEDGALRGVCQPDDSHGPVISVPIDAHDVTVEFRVKFAKAGRFLLLIDGDSQFGGEGHLLRFGLTPTQVQLAQDRGAHDSKDEQKKARVAAEKAGAKAPESTSEQLADPKFYRVETLVKQVAKADDGEWHRVHIELHGNAVLATLDDLPPLRGTGTVLDVKKSRLAFLIGQAGDIRVDDVRAWETKAKP